MYVLMLDTHVPIFEGALSTLDINQRDLIYWCKFYYHHVFSVAETERPDEFTIDYDVLLDNWLERKEFNAKNNRETRTRSDAGSMQHVISF